MGWRGYFYFQGSKHSGSLTRLASFSIHVWSPSCCGSVIIIGKRLHILSPTQFFPVFVRFLFGMFVQFISLVCNGGDSDSSHVIFPLWHKAMRTVVLNISSDLFLSQCTLSCSLVHSWPLLYLHLTYCSLKS